MAQELTKLYYEQNSVEYAEKTLCIQLYELWNKFAALLPPGAYVLDLGCGAGRDLKELSKRGFRLLGVDYSASLAEIARRHSGQDVWVADIRECDLGVARFQGIWAVASLLHIPRNEILRVLRKLHRSLCAGGVLLTSMKTGQGQDTSRDGRCFELYQREEWEQILLAAEFEIDESCVQEVGSVSWLLTICRKKETGPNGLGEAYSKARLAPAPGRTSARH